MVEKLEVYDLDGNLLAVQSRSEFFEEIKEEFAKTGKITRQVKTVRMLLMNSRGKIYLQKRSKSKQENPSLYDKTIGGHVARDDTFMMTLIRECVEELGIPAAVLPHEEFEKATRVTDLSVVGIFRKVDYISNYESVRITQKGEKFIQPLMNVMYVGYYDGPIRFLDGESSGVEVFTLEELKEELKNHPEKYTEDIKFMVDKYEEFLVPIDSRQ